MDYWKLNKENIKHHELWCSIDDMPCCEDHDDYEPGCSCKDKSRWDIEIPKGSGICEYCGFVSQVAPKHTYCGRRIFAQTHDRNRDIGCRYEMITEETV